MKQLAAVRYDDAAVARASDFRVQDVFASAIFAVACDDLAALADELERPADAARLRDWADESAAAVDASIDPTTGLARDRDLRTGEPIAVACLSGFAPLLSTRDGSVRRAQAALLADWCAAPGLAHRVPCSTAPGSPAFRPREYWRGPNWPVMTWLLAFGARRGGQDELYAALRDAAVAQLGDLEFAEYYEPFTAEPLGSPHQSWTAAVALDWLAG